ncbi:lactonase family protein [Neorhodopirellula pilleata]|uniref:6-phosphogluconolactonase n=1 Tax=Neorhodopirellula pilleata TaxID=2714738 RepID=A0A5C6AWZ0_9BACT|nr:lactonase family protein [Neorhodopirellula pilleata]TWU04027.1 6-phosphogluconolactonase [Neorhodopirellula pilleata]
MPPIFFARSVFLMSFLSATMASTVFAETVDVWFGTTTPRGGDSRGIYHAALNTQNGKLTKPTLAAEVNSPGFLALHPDGKTLYVTGSASGGNEVSAYRVEGTAGKATLRLINSVDTGDGGAAHLSTDHAGKVLLSAQYGGGSTTLYELAEDGAIARRVEVRSHAELLPQAGSGVVGNRQDQPHAHWTGTSPDDRFAFVPDLGMDKVVIWKLDQSTPAITHHGFGQCPPGGGPRHMKFSPDGSRIYVLNELALSITVFDYDSESGTMTAGQTIATLSDKTKAKETFNSASEIRVHPSGKYVYSANRGHDSISVFAVGDDGILTRIEVEPIRGGWPRNFNIDPTGQWLIAAGRDSNTATVFKIEPESGELTFIRETQTVPTPICVVFGKL